MRKIFSSQRLETVEGVAALLRQHGIEVRISNPRSYKGGRRREFSFLDRPQESELSAVWIVQVEQQPRARELLREAGLLATTRPGAGAQPGIGGAEAGRGSYFDPRQGADPEAGRDTATPRAPRWAWRIRIALLLLIAAAVVFVSLRHRAPQPAPAAPPAEQDEVRVRVQPATPDAPPRNE